MLKYEETVLFEQMLLLALSSSIIVLRRQKTYKQDRITLLSHDAENKYIYKGPMALILI